MVGSETRVYFGTWESEVAGCLTWGKGKGNGGKGFDGGFVCVAWYDSLGDSLSDWLALFCWKARIRACTSLLKGPWAVETGDAPCPSLGDFGVEMLRFSSLAEKSSGFSDMVKKSRMRRFGSKMV